MRSRCGLSVLERLGKLHGNAGVFKGICEKFHKASEFISARRPVAIALVLRPTQSQGRRMAVNYRSLTRLTDLLKDTGPALRNPPLAFVDPLVSTQTTFLLAAERPTGTTRAFLAARGSATASGCFPSTAVCHLGLHRVTVGCQAGGGDPRFHHCLEQQHEWGHPDNQQRKIHSWQRLSLQS
jgi:hypothetical protein